MGRHRLRVSSRLNQIKPLISDLTTEDRESFAALLQEANG
jgi:hypothetical protein